MQALSIRDYIIIAMVIMIGIMSWLMRGYKAEIKDLNYTVAIKEANEKTLKSSINRQNQELKNISEEYTHRIKEYYNEKPKIVTRYVNRYITKDINTTRSSCEDVNNVLDNIRNNGI